MSLAVSAADPTRALNRILRGNYQLVVERMKKLHVKLAAARPLEPLAADDGFDEATKIVAAEPAASTLVPLRRELARIDQAVDRQATSTAFAVQFRNERPAFMRQLERIDEVSAYLHHTRHAIRMLKVDSRRPR